MSRDPLANTIHARLPNVSKMINPLAHNMRVINFIFQPYMVANQLKILIHVRTAIIIVAAVK